MNHPQRRHPISKERQQMQKAFVDALGDSVVEVKDIQYRPVVVTIRKPLRTTLDVFLFTAFNPLGGRDAHEYKIQLLLQGHKGKMNFPESNNYPILVGFCEELNVFVFFDAFAHKDFSPNTNVQFRDDLIHKPTLQGIAWTRKGNGEIVISATANQILKALEYRLLDTLPPNEYFT